MNSSGTSNTTVDQKLGQRCGISVKKSRGMSRGTGATNLAMAISTGERKDRYFFMSASVEAVEMAASRAYQVQVPTSLVFHGQEPVYAFFNGWVCAEEVGKAPASKWIYDIHLGSGWVDLHGQPVVPLFQPLERTGKGYWVA